MSILGDTFGGNQLSGAERDDLLSESQWAEKSGW